MWWREFLLNFFVEIWYKLWGFVEVCSIFIWKVECILFLIEWLNWCCIFYFRFSVKFVLFICKWYSSVIYMGSFYFIWYFIFCKGNCCYGVIKKYYICMKDWYKMKRRIFINFKSGLNFVLWIVEMDYLWIGFGDWFF